MTDIHKALDIIGELNKKGPLKESITEIQENLRGSNADNIRDLLGRNIIDSSILNAAMVLKPKIGQLHEIIHAWGIIVSLPYILEPSEEIEYLSLAAGNTGKEFDLKTDRQIAEFKFITWRGGPEAIRQNSLFVDFYGLAENESHLDKYLYLMGSDVAKKFLENSKRAISSVISKSPKIRKAYLKEYKEKYPCVKDYYAAKKDLVKIIDLKEKVPDFSKL
jgi:hypothetical protein